MSKLLEFLSKYKILFVIALVFSIAMVFIYSNVADARTCKLSWSPNPETDIQSYKLYWGTSGRTSPSPTGTHGYTNTQNVGNVTSYDLSNGLSNNLTYYFSLTAINTGGLESLTFSNEVSSGSLRIPPLAPTGLMVK